MGPRQDNRQCSPDLAQACPQGRRPTDNQVNILQFDGQTGYMLVCGSVWQGRCELRSSRNISEVVTLTNSPINFVGSIDKKNVYGFFGSRPVGDSSGGSLLYVAMGQDGRPSQYRPAAISTRKYQTKDKTFHYYINNSNLQQHTYIDVHPSLRNLFKANYIYGFENERHVYFISIQMEDALATPPKFLTKIIQICREDMSYASYTELPIQCVSDSVVYNIAIDAYYTESVRTRDGSFGLAVTFGRTSLGAEADGASGSVLCFYDIDDIIYKFETLQSQCFNNGIGSQVTWLVGKSLQEVRSCETDVSNKRCGVVFSCPVILFFCSCSDTFWFMQSNFSFVQ
jgi:plexin A